MSDAKGGECQETNTPNAFVYYASSGSVGSRGRQTNTGISLRRQKVVKEFGNYFEEFVVQYLRRVRKFPLVVRDYLFRKTPDHCLGNGRKSPTDLDVLGICQGKAAVVTCQETVPFGSKDATESLRKLAGHLRAAVDEVREHVLDRGAQVVPMIGCVTTTKEGLQRLDEELGKCCLHAGILFCWDMAQELAREYSRRKYYLPKPEETWAPWGEIDWLFGRVAYLGKKLKPVAVSEKAENWVKCAIGGACSNRKYNIASVEHFTKKLPALKNIRPGEALLGQKVAERRMEDTNVD